MATHTFRIFAAVAAYGAASFVQAGGVYNSATTVDDGAGSVVGMYSSIAIGTDGFPVISYYDDRAQALKVAHCYDVACIQQPQITFVDDTSTLIEGRYSAIAIGDDGMPVISYQGGTGDTLKVAKCTDLACTLPATITEVDNPANITGTFTSIAIGVNGRPSVSYTGSGLNVAHCTNTDCTGTATVTKVDTSSVLTGYHTSIAIGNDGFPVISYYDLTNELLKVAKCGNASCSTVTATTEVDAAGSVGGYTAIAVRNNGHPVVSYFDAANGTLKIAECTNSACTGSATAMTLLAVPGEVVGQYSDIAIGPTGKAFVSHFNATVGSLMLTVCQTSDCADGTITTTLDAALPGDAPRGEYSSLAIGADNLPVMSYFDAQAGTLKVAHCGTRNCDGLFHDGFDDLPPTSRPESAEQP